MSSLPLASLLPKPTKKSTSALEGEAGQHSKQLTRPLDFGPKKIQPPAKPTLIANTMLVSTVPVEYDDQGLVKYDILARVGHDQDRQVQAGYADALPKDLLVGHGDEAVMIEFKKPSPAEIERQLDATRRALEAVVAEKIAATQPKNVVKARQDTFVKYKPDGHVNSSGLSRVVRVVDLPTDPLEPPKFHHKRIPRPPQSPPTPVLHSPPRKASVAQQQAWKVPPCISNWKNPKGYTIPLDKRLASDGRGLQEAVVNDRFAGFAEALYLAEKHAKDELDKRAIVDAQLAERERAEKDQRLRKLADRARHEGSHSARDRNGRDVSEPVALGRPSAAHPENEAAFDARLFNRTSGITSGYADDDTYDLYDKPLFARATSGIDAMHRPQLDSEIYGSTSTGVEYSVPKPTRSFRGAAPTTTHGDDDGGQHEKQVRRYTEDRPVHFVEGASLKAAAAAPAHEEADPFGLDRFLSEAKHASSSQHHRATAHHERRSKQGRRE